MEKLVFVYYWGDEGCSGQSIIPFEYSSKDDAILALVNKAEITIKEYGYATLFDSFISLSKHEVENIYHCVFTLEEWFENSKEKI